MTATAEELTAAISELEGFRQSAEQEMVQQFLDEKLQNCRSKLDEINRRQLLSQQNGKSKEQAGGGVRPLKKLTNYAFDESDKFVKLYYTVPGISNANAEKIKSSFQSNAFEVICTDVAGIDYEMRATGLFEEIVADKCQVKQKSGDLLLVMLKKAKEGQSWGSLLKLDKKEKFKPPKMDKDEDPSSSLMGMMKQMYEEGDDEMKRTIRKAWHEAQNKKTGGLDMDF